MGLGGEKSIKQEKVEYEIFGKNFAQAIHKKMFFLKIVYDFVC